MAAASVGLAVCSALLVHLWDGRIQAHFHFFVMIGLLTLYQDWLPFLVAIGFASIHLPGLPVRPPGARGGHRPARRDDRAGRALRTTKAPRRAPPFKSYGRAGAGLAQPDPAGVGVGDGVLDGAEAPDV
jgi:hypothetical protein